MNKEFIKVIVLIVVIFVASALAGYYLLNRPSLPAAPRSPSPAASPAGTAPVQSQPSTAASDNGDSVLEKIFGTGGTALETGRSEDWPIVVARVTLRLTLAALLTALLAFRPRRFAILFKRNLFVAQTQILLAVVGSALMIIVGDNAARAFGIFAAVSLVRFRTNIRDPKEITVLLVSLGVGLATGVGRWELAAILCFFVLGLLWVLEYREPERVFRTLELKIRTHRLEETREAVGDVLKKYGFASELRALNRENEAEPLGSLVLSAEVSPLVSTDELSAEILSVTGDQVDSIEWTQQKSASSLFV